MGLIAFFMKRERFVLAMLMSLIIFGAGSYFTISKEAYPDVSLPMAYIKAEFYGASAEENDILLLKPIATEITSVAGVKKINSYATDNLGYLVVEFEESTSLFVATQEIRTKIDNIRGTLPNAVRSIEVNEVNVSMFPILNIILRSDMQYRQLLNIANALKDKITGGVRGVLEANIVGDRSETIDIVVKPGIMEGYGVTLSQVMAIINRSNSFNAIGEIRQKNGQYAITVNTIISNMDDIMNIPLHSSNGGVIYLKDVAEILYTYRDPVTAARVNGKEAIAIEISKKVGVDITQITKDIKSVVSNLQEFYPENLEILYSQDSSSSVKDSVRNLENNVVFSMLIVFLIIRLCSNFNLAFLVALTIPGSFFVGILSIDTMGHTINMMVLFGLMLSVGILVDSALVVVEAADRLVAIGDSPRKAFSNATVKMSAPVIASTMTTIIVFLPLLFWPGTTGSFLKYLPLTVLFVMCGSLAMSLVFIPTLGTLWYQMFSSKNEAYIKRVEVVERFQEDKFPPFVAKYHNCLKQVLENPKRFMKQMLLLSAGVVIVFSVLGLGLEFFPEVEPDNALIMVKARGNLSFEEKTRIVQEVENKILDMTDDVRLFYSRIGQSQSDGNIGKDIIAKIFLELQPWDKRRKADVILSEMIERLKGVPGVGFEAIKQGVGPPKASDIQLLLTSRFGTDALLKASAAVRKAMHDIGGFTYIKDSLSSGAFRFNLHIDDQKTALMKVDRLSISQSVSMFTNGLSLGQYYGGKDTMDIMLRQDYEHRSLGDMLSSRIGNADGIFVSMDDFAQLEAKPAISIERVGVAHALRIHANVKKGLVANNQLLSLRDALKKDWDPRVDFKFEGQAEDMGESKTFLIKAFASALILIILILLLMFNNVTNTLIVLTAIFFSIIGVLIGLLVTHAPFGVVMCGMGVVTLSGLAVNNNILLIEAYEHYIAEGMSIKDSIIRAAISRFRPILLTSSTTVLGLLPMVLKLNIDFFQFKISYDAPSSQFWTQFSGAIVGGMTFSTIVAMFFTPSALMWIKSRQALTRERTDQIRGTNSLQRG